MDFSTCRVISALSHLIGSQRGFFVPGEPRTGDTRRNLRDDRKGKLRTEYLKVQFRHFLIELFRQQEDIDLASLSFLPISQKNKLRKFETLLLRRTPTQTATRHSASLPVHKLVFCSLLMTLPANSHGDFPHNDDGSVRGRLKLGTLLHCLTTQDCSKLVLQWVGSGSPEYAKDSNNGTSRSHKQKHNDRSPAM